MNRLISFMTFLFATVSAVAHADVTGKVVSKDNKYNL